MEKKVYQAYKSDFQNGIVTLGDICNANCLFCSQKWNPPGIIASLGRLLTFKEIKHFIDLYLDEVSWIASAIHTNSGEFFLHPNAIETLRYIAKKIKLDGTWIFTNGMNLTSEHIKVIKELNLTLCLSLNSADLSIRKKNMGGDDNANANAVHSLDVLNNYDANYVVWIVPLRTALNSGDLERTVKYVKSKKLVPIIISKPGYTKYTPPYIAHELNIPDDHLYQFAVEMRERYGMNITTDIEETTDTIREIMQRLKALFKRREYLKKRKLFLFSQSVKNIFPAVVEIMRIENYTLKAVPSVVFGGNIECSGLLLLQDYIHAIEEALEADKDKKPELVILSRRSFDINLEDLSMVSIKELENKFKTKVVAA